MLIHSTRKNLKIGILVLEKSEGPKTVPQKAPEFWGRRSFAPKNYLLDLTYYALRRATGYYILGARKGKNSSRMLASAMMCGRVRPMRAYADSRYRRHF